MEQPKKLRQVIHFRADHIELLEAIAEKRGANLADVVREACIAYWSLPTGPVKDTYAVHAGRS